ncbi:right-handed parallel beta-helix repeat-containing protein [Geobacter sp.]|uniref:right-handed parallel beta-helix repeat-containing protein n=1 Tax=Geobacter sp. TaxID=46610 RepID=UPI0026017C36|nr:right-handed parallel beta-helix repeat-containing protein [Geobacter sp.]
MPSPERAPLPGAMRIAPAATAPEGARVYRDEILVEDTVWRGEVVVEGSVMVSPQTTLTVEPGAVVRFRRTSAGVGAGPRLLVQGRFVVRGSAESPARFTSVFPESRPGDWEGIVLLGSQKKNELEHARIEGAAIGVDAVYSTVYLRDVGFHNCGTGGRFQDGVVSVSGGEALGGDAGMEFMDSEADVRDASIARNRVGLTVRDSSLNLEGATVTDNATVGLSVAGGRIRLERNLFVGNGTGLVLEGCEGSVARGRIAGNREAGMVLTRSRVKVVANEIVDNAGAGLRVDDGRGAAWGNVFENNGRYDLYNAGSEVFRAMANWWGESASGPIGKKVFGAAEAGRGGVLLTPALSVKPLLPTLNYIAK